jgi:hypothetical protein
VFIISPKFCLKAPSVLEDPSIESLELTRGRFFWAVLDDQTLRADDPTLRVDDPVGAE